jgi:hypothetical protein
MELWNALIAHLKQISPVVLLLSAIVLTWAMLKDSEKGSDDED